MLMGKKGNVSRWLGGYQSATPRVYSAGNQLTVDRYPYPWLVNVNIDKVVELRLS